MIKREAHLVLADGTRFSGTAVGAAGTTTGEVVFTTGMTGYQEVLTDPSYAGQIVVMTSPEMGNVGVNLDDAEAKRPRVAGFVMHELSPIVSNWRANESLAHYLERWGIVALADVDTRTLTRVIRDRGAQMAAMGTDNVATLHDRAKAAPPMHGRNLADEVSIDAASTWELGLVDDFATRDGRAMPSGRSAATGDRPHVVAIDFGVKHGILRCLVDAGCRVTVVPSRTSSEEVLSLAPDGVFLSNGPGDPAAVETGIRTVRDLVGKKPIFGICLGHQILALALGGTTSKLKFGHRGLNQPVKDLATGRIEITTQNHGFVVDLESLRDRCALTHVNLNDGTCEGLEHRDADAFSVQYHPEASAGPHDARYLFDRFVQRMTGGQ